ncbi:MAG: hypothetical protein Q8J76_14515, partial [Desulfobulbaceae bacterium]|nr:hypothetical protein [Desulfobulbaceae bacterium]
MLKYMLDLKKLFAIAICFSVLGCSIDNRTASKPELPPLIEKAISMFYDENRNDEVISLLNNSDSTNLNPLELQLRRIIMAGAWCESNNLSKSRTILNGIPNDQLKKNSYLNSWHQSISGLLLFRENKLSEAYSVLIQENTKFNEPCVLALNKRILARITIAMNDYKQGLEWLLESSLLFEKAGKPKSIAINEKIIGRCYMLVENFDEAIKHLKAA